MPSIPVSPRICHLHRNNEESCQVILVLSMPAWYLINLIMNLTFHLGHSSTWRWSDSARATAAWVKAYYNYKTSRSLTSDRAHPRLLRCRSSPQKVRTCSRGHVNRFNALSNLCSVIGNRKTNSSGCGSCVWFSQTVERFKAQPKRPPLEAARWAPPNATAAVRTKLVGPIAWLSVNPGFKLYVSSIGFWHSTFGEKKRITRNWQTQWNNKV